MTQQLRPYTAYRASGIDYLGNVPAHWEVRQLGRVGRFFKGNGGTKDDDAEQGVPCVRYGDLYTHHRYFITESRACVAPETAAAAYTPLRYGDVPFAGSGETIDEIGKFAVNMIPGPACCGGDVIIFRPTIEIDARFLGYATDCRQAAYQKACMGRGITVMHIYGGELKYMTVAPPSVAEQAAIVRFLDHADRRIRRYIRAKEKLIALLEEQRQAVIHEAVTGRINVWTGLPHGRYKRSTIDSLQVVPDHWEARRLGQIARVFNGTTPSRAQPAYWENGTVSWLNSSKANDEIVVEASELVTEKAVRECSIGVAPSGAVILGLVGQGRTRGMSVLLGIEAAINQNLAAIVPGPLVDGRFLHRLLTAFYANIREAGREGNQEALNCELVSRLRLPVPPLVEQIEIVSRVEHALGKLKRGITRAGEEVGLIREYRSRLIADAVTGKLDVRDMAARLPELDPLAAGGDPVDGGDRDAGPVWTGERPTEQAGGRVAAGQ